MKKLLDYLRLGEVKDMEGLDSAVVSLLQANIIRKKPFLKRLYVDFYKQLKSDPTQLRVLGNGRQRKSYLYVQDCIDAILCALQRASGQVNIFNLGTDEYCEVNDSINWVTQELGLAPALTYAGGPRGWVGDSPFVFLDCQRMRSLGWQPQISIRDGVIRTLRYLQSNPWLLDIRR